MQSVFDAGEFIDGNDPDLTTIDIKPVCRTTCISCRTPMSQRPEISCPPVPDSSLKRRHHFQTGSGRLELADDIFSQGVHSRPV